MDGNKWRLFCLDLSFLGWELLCTLPMLIGSSLVLPSPARRIRSCSADPAVHPAERRLFLSAPHEESGLGDLLPGYHRCLF